MKGWIKKGEKERIDTTKRAMVVGETPQGATNIGAVIYTVVQLI